MEHGLVSLLNLFQGSLLAAPPPELCFLAPHPCPTVFTVGRSSSTGQPEGYLPKTLPLATLLNHPYLPPSACSTVSPTTPVSPGHTFGLRSKASQNSCQQLVENHLVITDGINKLLKYKASLPNRFHVTDLAFKGI